MVLGLLIGVLLAVPAGAGATDVTVRVEGATQTLVPKQSVTLPAVAPQPDGINACSAGSAGAALWVATGGQWSGTWYGSMGDYLLTSVKGESYTYPDPRSWELWVDGRSAATGPCGTSLAAGADVLLLVQRCDEYDSDYNCTTPPTLPLRLAVPATATAGVPFTVTVKLLARDGTATAASGVTIGGGREPVTTGADGTAQVTIDSAAAAVALNASKAGTVRDSATLRVLAPDVPVPAPPVCVSNGADGLCGSPDRTAPAVRLAVPLEGRRFTRATAPRTLKGSVTTGPSGVARIELRITRRTGKRCVMYDGARERFVRMRRCGAARGVWFPIGTGADWSYLLPGPLARGRYVVDVRATDRAGNVTTLARHSTRSVFFVD